MGAQNMSSAVTMTKTQHYLKVRKPQLERNRRARMNKTLDVLKHTIADLQGDDSILKLDKADMMEAVVRHTRQILEQHSIKPLPTPVPMDGFKNGFINATHEVQRILTKVPEICNGANHVLLSRLGTEFQNLVMKDVKASLVQQQSWMTASPKSAPCSPASSGYHSGDNAGSSQSSPASSTSSPSMLSSIERDSDFEQKSESALLWQPWL